MKAIHPFPARMAPDAIADLLDNLSADATVLDPMCGSGVVVRQSLLSGRRGIGADIDPLAVLMSRVWTSKKRLGDIEGIAATVAAKARKMRLGDFKLPWIDGCRETREFVDYWYAAEQRRALRKLAARLYYDMDALPAHVRDCLWIALSRTIVTKHYGATLAWDVSHSRPHRKIDENDFDVFRYFVRRASETAKAMAEHKLVRSGKILNADCRRLPLRGIQIDAVITSPPYLNAIDYMRGHRLSLIWMGYALPHLRDIRATSLGTERARLQVDAPDVIATMNRALPEMQSLPPRLQNIVRKYALDADAFLSAMKKVVRPGGQLITVLGNSNLRGCFIENSSLYAALAKRHGYRLRTERERELPANRRYLPTNAQAGALAKRMSYEVIQAYALPG
jgi:SAM-dependent methyltransferase